MDKYDVVIVSSNRYNDFIDSVGDIVWKRFIFDEASSTHIPKMRHIQFGFMWLITATYEYLYAFKGTKDHFLTNFMRNIPYQFLEYFLIWERACLVLVNLSQPLLGVWRFLSIIISTKSPFFNS